MELVKWNPWQELANMEQHMNKIMGEAFHGTPARHGRAAGTWHPVVDIYEKENEIVIEADLPGVGKDDITIDLKDRVLTLKGRKSDEKETKAENYYRRERIRGEFLRSFTLPPGTSGEEIRADFKEGVLSIVIPKHEKQPVKQIPIH